MDHCRGYGGYAIPHAMPEYGTGVSVLAEFCTLIWMFCIVKGAELAPYPNNILFWIWAIGMLSCIPITAWLGARNDPDTTMWRETIYFFRRGMIGMRMVGWPIYLLIAYFKQSERKIYIHDQFHQVRASSYYIKHETAREMADKCAEKIDRNCDEVQELAKKKL